MEDLHGKKDINQSIYLQYKESTTMELYLHYLEKQSAPP
jgi:hypothetical protein